MGNFPCVCIVLKERKVIANETPRLSKLEFKNIFQIMLGFSIIGHQAQGVLNATNWKENFPHAGQLGYRRLNYRRSPSGYR